MQVHVASHSTSERTANDLRWAAESCATLDECDGWVFLVQRMTRRIMQIDKQSASGAGKMSEREYDCLITERRVLVELLGLPEKVRAKYAQHVARQPRSGE